MEAFRSTIPVSDIDGTPLSESRAFRLVSSAIEEGHEAGFNVHFLERALEHMKNTVPIGGM